MEKWGVGILNNDVGGGKKNSLKKGGGPSEKEIGGGCSQNALLKEFESSNGFTAAASSLALGTGYNTYKEWKSGRRKMTGPTLKLIKVLMAIKGTGVGKKFGV